MLTTSTREKRNSWALTTDSSVARYITRSGHGSFDITSKEPWPLLFDDSLANHNGEQVNALRGHSLATVHGQELALRLVPAGEVSFVLAGKTIVSSLGCKQLVMAASFGTPHPCFSRESEDRQRPTPEAFETYILGRPQWHGTCLALPISEFRQRTESLSRIARNCLCLQMLQP